MCFSDYQYVNGYYIRWPSLPSTVSAALAQPTFNRSACRPPKSLVGHISTLLNVVMCWFLGSELSLADRVSTLQLQSSRTRSISRGQCYKDGLLKTISSYDPPRTLDSTPSTPAVPNFCRSQGSARYWSNPPFLIFDIRALWRSVLSARAPECQNLKMAG